MDFEEQLEQDRLAAPTQDFLASVNVFPLIPYLKTDITNSIDTPLSWEQLTATDVNFTLVRPLVLKYARLQNMAVVVLAARATLCEILALKLLSYFASSKLQLVAVLTTLWNPLAGAPRDVVEDVKEVLHTDEALENSQSAIEMAIATKAKAFLASAVVQSVIDDMFTGRIVFTIIASRSLVADNYKQRAIEVYDVRRAPFLDHYRLRVPRYSNILHFLNIAMLTLIFVLCLRTQHTQSVSTWEAIFLVFATGFALQEYTASQEYGWRIYISNVWNLFDTSFVLVFLAYAGLRAKGLIYDEAATSKLAFDLLACGACILVPRLAFYAIAHNVVVLALRAMISEFMFFMCIAVACFSGLLFTLYTLASDQWSVKHIAWLMLQIWFGNNSLSFQQASSFHPVLGPILMISFAALANTLLLTILISILSNTAARIDENSNQEYLFQHAITTIEGVKSDALFSYQPPFNILAFLILKSASYILSPRALHSVNVFLIKLTSFPILIVIAIYERRLVSGRRRKASKTGHPKRALYQSLPRHLKNLPLVEYLVGSKSSNLYDAIFEVEESREFTLFSNSGNGEGVDPSLEAVSVLPASPMSLPLSPGHTTTLSDSQQSPRRPRKRKISTLAPLQEVTSSATVLTLDTTTPLSKLFSHSRPATAVDHESGSNLDRMQGLLDPYRDFPLHRFQDEMKEIQDRQRRIENLLITLTRNV